MAVEKVTPNYLKKSGFELPYTIIINETIDIIPDNSAMGVYLYLARKPQDWDIQEKDIMKRFKKGRDHIRKCLSILKDIGLYKKESIRDGQGHITHWESTLYFQVPENPLCGVNQVTENPTSGKTHLLDNPTHTKERPLEKKEKEKKRKSIADSTNTATDITPSSKIKDYEKDERFMRFYNAYPKKVKPRDAWNAFKNIVGKNDQLLLKILVDLKERSTRHSQWQEKQYIPYPATYLRSADYDSEIINEAQEAERKRQESKTQAEQRLANQESLSKQRRDMERINNESKHNDAFAMKGVVESTHPSAPPPAAWNALKKKLNIRQG